MRERAGPNVTIAVQQGDALAIQADVLALKYAKALYGVDREAVQAIAAAVPDIQDRLPQPAGFCIMPTMNTIGAKSVLFVGVGPLYDFGYKEIRAFGRKVRSSHEQCAGPPAIRGVRLTK